MLRGGWVLGLGVALAGCLGGGGGGGRLSNVGESCLRTADCVQGTVCVANACAVPSSCTPGD
ncbi:MAG: hypothetical protein KC583_02860, partial [Myxococcales bacterium]|nr:hypothetical protein [Myxococcales bacterium]